MIMERKHKIVIAMVIISAIINLLVLFKKQSSSRPNVILITVDALRADHLGCYGYPRDTSPNIDRLAKEGVTFLNCFSASCGTAYSLPALLTGRYLEVGKDYVFYDNILDKQFTTLAEYLKNSGYYTVAFVNNGHLKINKGFEHGFDYYRYKWDNKNAAEEMTASALNFLNYYRGNKPIFLWIHYLDVHVPYLAPKEYIRAPENAKLYKKNDEKIRLSPETTRNPYTSRGYIPRIAFHKDQQSLNYYVACYDTGILHTDFYLGKLLKDVDKNNIIILTADHGEFLGEHNYYFVHEEAIYDEALHVPLIIKDNRDFKGGRRIALAVSLVDIVPTVLSKIKPAWYFLNKDRFDGRDLKGILKGADIKRGYIYSYWPWAWSIRDSRQDVKYILNKDRQDELYLLPDEYNNLINDTSLELISIKKKLHNALVSWLKRHPIPSDVNSKKAVFFRGRYKKAPQEFRVSSLEKHI